MTSAPSQESNRQNTGPSRTTRTMKLAVFSASLALIASLGARPARLASDAPTPMADLGAQASLAFDDEAARLVAVGRPRPRHVRPGVRFSFAVISDIHNLGSCDIAQGPKLPEAIRVLNGLDPEFVVGVGDLAAGGGDCLEWGKGYPEHSLENQLAELKRVLLDRLEAPFVPVSGNHELSTAGTRDNDYPWRTWTAFWTANQRHVLPEARPITSQRSHRFVYKGIGFSLLGYYGTLGLHKKEWRFAEANVGAADLVFRHVNPYGISCHNQWTCGYAMRSWPTRRYEKLTDLLSSRDVTALFTGHTHAFYDGRCGGLRYVNTGALGDRSMESVKGWHRSPFKERQSFVWVDVLTNASIRVTFFVWDPKHRTFLPFDNRYFPREVVAEKHEYKSFSEGVAARCVSNRLPPDEHWGYLRRRAEAARLARLALQAPPRARHPLLGRPGTAPATAAQTPPLAARMRPLP